MLHAVVYNLCLLLIISSCAKKKRAVSCANLDPNTGACLRHESSVADPNDTETIMRRAVQNSETLNAELRRLQEEKAVLEARINRGEGSPSDQAEVNRLDDVIIGIIGKAGEIGLSPEPQVDTSKVPAVTLNLKHKDKTGVRPTFSFTHVTDVSEVNFSYGKEKGESLVFKYDYFVEDRIQLEVRIPVALRFKFGDVLYCASHEFSKNFGEGTQSMTVSKCQ